MRPTLLTLLIACLSGCACVVRDAPVDREDLTAGVLAMAQQVADDRARVGPEAWLIHFEDADGFYLASDGALVFADHGAAERFVTPFDSTIESITLEWLEPRVEPIARGVAVLHAA